MRNLRMLCLELADLYHTRDETNSKISKIEDEIATADGNEVTIDNLQAELDQRCQLIDNLRADLNATRQELANAQLTMLKATMPEDTQRMYADIFNEKRDILGATAGGFNRGKIAAIKQMRHDYNLGLKDAKDLCEYLGAKYA